jgi:hypothetical protein
MSIHKKKPEAPTHLIQQTLSACTRYRCHHQHQLLSHLERRYPHNPHQACRSRCHGARQSPTLYESIMSRPSPRPRYTTPPRLLVVDVVDAHYSTDLAMKA